MTTQETTKVNLDKEQSTKSLDNEQQVQVAMYSVTRVVSELTTPIKDSGKSESSSSVPNWIIS